MIIIDIYYHIFMNLTYYWCFFVDFTLSITLQLTCEFATEAFPWTGKNSSRISFNKLREFVRKKNSKWICDI